jgi:hypothetical protein
VSRNLEHRIDAGGPENWRPFRVHQRPDDTSLREAVALGAVKIGLIADSVGDADGTWSFVLGGQKKLPRHFAWQARDPHANGRETAAEPGRFQNCSLSRKDRLYTVDLHGAMNFYRIRGGKIGAG